jgi:hypothetical protein
MAMAEQSRFLPNKYARCECELVDTDIDAPICTHFEDEDEDSDICVSCRHGELCHLKGHEPNSIDNCQHLEFPV